MPIQFHRHPATLHCLPVASIHELECECCEEFAGFCIEIGWLFWSVSIAIGAPDSHA